MKLLSLKNWLRLGSFVYIILNCQPLLAGQACADVFFSERDIPEARRIKNELRQLGREISAAKAKELSNKGSLADYLAGIRQDELPDGLRKQIDWAIKNQAFFVELWENGVRPLDVADLFGQKKTVVEHLWHVIDSKEHPTAELLERYWKNQVKYHLHNPYGAKIIRGNNKFGQSLAMQRPELTTFFRPSELESLKLRAHELRRKLKNIYFREYPTRGFNADDPGIIIGTSLRQLPAEPTGDFFRLSWNSFETVDDAVLYILNGGEHAQVFRDDRNQSRSIWSIVREVKHLSKDYLEGIATFSSISNFSPNKFFISVSSEKLDTFGEDVGNLRIHIKTDRAFKVPGTMSNINEMEYGLPFILNPKEVLGGEMNFGTEGSTTFTFKWSDDYRNLEVQVQNDKSVRTLIFSYDQSRKSYVRQ